MLTIYIDWELFHSSSVFSLEESEKDWCYLSFKYLVRHTMKTYMLSCFFAELFIVLPL